MKFCIECGSNQISLRIPSGDNRPRHVCNTCKTIHYQNPRLICGCLATWQDKILLCRRAIEPRYGYWTLPAGFMENSETTAEAAARETQEEAHAPVVLQGLYALFNLPHISQVHVFYRATLVDGQYGAGEESLESHLFAAHDIPWDELAFPTITQTLRFFLADKATSHFPFRTATFDPKTADMLIEPTHP